MIFIYCGVRFAPFRIVVEWRYALVFFWHEIIPMICHLDLEVDSSECGTIFLHL